MRDIEQLLREALQRQGEDYEPNDPHGARAAFVERLRRRRRLLYLRTGGAVAAVALIAAVVLMPGPLTEPGPDVDLASVTPEVVATIPVGGAPSSSSPASDGAVWVATGEEVVAIDPDVNGVVMNARTAGRSDEVAAGDDHVWVATTEGHISMVSSQSGSVLARTSVPRAQPLDIAASGDSLWAVGINDGNLYETSASPEGFDDGAAGAEGSDGGDESTEDDGLFIFEQNFLNMPLTDVAVGDAGLWVLFRDGDSAGVFLVDPEDITGGGTPIPVEAGNSSDLAVGLHAVWLATGDKGTVERIDPRTGEITASVEVGGRYTDLAVGEGVVWAVTGGDGPSRLYQIGADGEFIGEPLELEGDPVDVAVGAGAVWVADQEEGDVLRIEPQPRAEAPTREPTLTPEPDAGINPNDVLYVFSRDGDLFAKLVDGEVRQLTDTEELELAPAFAPGGEDIAFERAIPADQTVGECTGERIVLETCVERTDIALFNLETGRVGPLVADSAGWSPAVAPKNDRLAWFTWTDEGAPQIVIGETSGEDHLPFDRRTTYAISPETEIGRVDDLQWSRDGEALYFVRRWDGWTLNQVSLEGLEDGQVVDPFVLPAGGGPRSPQIVASAAADLEGIYVVALCCRTIQDPWETAELGRVSFTESGAQYEKLRDLGLPVADYTSVDPIMATGDRASAGLGERFNLESLGTWGPGPQGEAWGEDVGMIDPGTGGTGSFLVSDGENIWWFAGGEEGPFELIDDEGTYFGISGNPRRLGY